MEEKFLWYLPANIQSFIAFKLLPELLDSDLEPSMCGHLIVPVTYLSTRGGTKITI